MRVRVALTRVEVLIVIVIIGLLLSILVPTLRRARELNRRTRCASNLKGIATGLYTGSGNVDDWWRADWPGYIDETRKGRAWSVEYTQAIGSYRSTDLSHNKSVPERLSVTRGLWQIVREGAASPNSFICPASADIPNTEVNATNSFDFGEGMISGPVSIGQAAQFWHQVSYGYQVPFGQFGYPSSDRDQRMVLMADKGPYGANIDAGQAAPPAFPAAGLPADWRPWNSPNHDGQGQTVLYADTHAEFIYTPLTPSNSDNIYTRWTTATDDASGRSRGLAPAPGLKLVPASNTDSLLYP